MTGSMHRTIKSPLANEEYCAQGRRLKVVSVTHYFPYRKGGIEVVAFEINRRLAADGHSVEWFASEAPALPDVIQGLRYRPVRAVNLVERLTGIPLPIWLSRGVLQLWQAIKKCDVVHVHDYIYPGSILALAFGRICNKPVILTQHIGDIPYKNKILHALLASLNHTVGHIALSQASHVVFISNAVETYFRSFITFRAQPIYLPNGVDASVFSPPSQVERQLLKEQLGLRAGVFICLFVGRFVEKKGLSLLSKLVAQTPEIQWLFAGEGPMHPQSWGAQNVRVFEGWRREKLAQLYQVADLLVLPSLGEGFPLVVQEAFACGTPALVSDDTATGCASAQHLLFDLPVTGDHAATDWANYLRSLMDNRSRLDARRPAVAEFSKKAWNWEASVARYVELYSSHDCSA